MSDDLSYRAIGIKKGFAGVQVLRGIDFQVRPGTIHALLGHNGAGKSTLLKILAGAQPQDTGVLKVAGEAVPEQNAHRTPRFETYFQNYEKYWFPAYASADDTVRMGRYSTRVIVKVRFTSYKKVTANG